MAAKIKEGIRDITQGVVERLKGGPKYADNLLGESLQDQLRKATAKELLEPSEELTSQVVDTINQDVANGKDSKEIVGLLKKRLRTDNPHKQWLAVLLVGRVMRDCAASLGPHQEELLREVAAVMTRPARQDSSAGRTTRQAAKDLLKSYGRAGTSAFRAVTRSTIDTASNAADYSAAINAAEAREAATVIEEVTALIEQARAATELLSEMLLAEQNQGQSQGQAAQGQGGGDEFENELTRELATEIRELRSLFDAYLEQMQSMNEPAVESLMMRALEAVDLLEGALALQKDVASNQRELEQQAAAGGSGGAGGVATFGSAGAALGDLISLEDLADALDLPQPPPVLAGNPAVVPPPAAPAAAQVAAAAAPAAAAAARPGPIDPFATLDPAAVQAALSPTTSVVQPGGHQAHREAPVAGQSTYPSPPYSAYPQQQQQPSHPQPYAYPQQPPQPHQQQLPYGMYGAPAAAAPYGGSNAGNPFAAAAAPILPYGAAAAQPPPLGTAASAGGGNPFGAGTGAGKNPFALTPATPAPLASGGGSSNAAAVDSEWAMFFADRTAGATAAQQQQQQQQQH